MKKAFLPLAMFLAAFAGAGHSGEVPLRWLEGRPRAGTDGTTVGVPWPRGSVAADAEFSVRDNRGESVPGQHWRLATWPDGSLKWSAHALVGGAEAPESYRIAVGPAQAPDVPVRVAEDGDTITVDNGTIQCRLAKKGQTLIVALRLGGRDVAVDGRLVALSRDKPAMDGVWREESFRGEIESAVVEQRGPVRAVVKVEGKHVNAGGRRWLPFVVRLYFYTGSDSVRLMHTLIFDGDEKKDFVSGLGLRYSAPMRGASYDRHVRFAGEDGGVFAEAVQGVTGLRRDPGEAVRKAQVAGAALPPPETWNPRVGGALKYIPAFGDYTLHQGTADSFGIRKRTRDGFVWLDAGHGRRSAGLGYLGGPEGGTAFGIRNFWQSHPAQLDIRHAARDAAEVTLWLWSPQSPPMDLRFYHDGMGQDTHEEQLQGLDITYEDYEPGFATPHGIARTSEMRLWALPATPSAAVLAGMAERLQAPPQPVCPPETYHAAGIFGGNWGLPDRSTPFKAAVEDQLDANFAHYRKEVEQRRWYGFWHYGDFMHGYDADRHVWRYDVGGYAWDNSELSPDLWLWYAFLRGGRADVFRVAEAMTRHTGEVDVYHLGRFKGLGTRHGVVHWGDSAKQLRISTAANRRFLYYLTADERVGDLLWEQVDTDRMAGVVPAGRKLAQSGHPDNPPGTDGSAPGEMNMNTGTNWYAIASALLTAWERTGDAKYRDKLRNGMKTIGDMPYGLFHSAGRYDPDTGSFRPSDAKVTIGSLAAVFGGVEMNAEMLQLLEVPGYEKAWLDFCRLYNASRHEQRERLGRDVGTQNLQQAASRMTAYAAWKTGDAALGERAWKEFLSGKNGPRLRKEPHAATSLSGPAVLNPIDEMIVSTNGTSQWGLAAIQCLYLAGDYAPRGKP